MGCDVGALSDRFNLAFLSASVAEADAGVLVSESCDMPTQEQGT